MTRGEGGGGSGEREDGETLGFVNQTMVTHLHESQTVKDVEARIYRECIGNPAEEVVRKARPICVPRCGPISCCGSFYLALLFIVFSKKLFDETFCLHTVVFRVVSSLGNDNQV